MTITNYKDGFNSGYQQLRQKDVAKARAALWAALGCRNRVTFSQYKRGIHETTATQAVNVELVFRSFGITENIWGK